MMVILYILSSYIASVFITRYVDIKVNFYIHVLHFRAYLEQPLWLVPIGNLIYVIMLIGKFINYKAQISNNFLVMRFFMSSRYKTKEETKLDIDFDILFNKKPNGKKVN